MHSSKSIFTLIPDIYQLVGKRDGWFTEVLASDLGREIALKMQSRFQPREPKGTLRLSKMGDTCPCALWHSVNRPELEEQLQPWAQIKFMYGDLLECMVLTLAKAAGHSVEGEQDAVTVDGIVGHRDAIIDGCLVDVKSVNQRSLEKFRRKQLAEDPFCSAYLDQLDGYLVGSSEDSRLRVKDRGYLIAIDKVLGHMVLYEHRLREEHIRNRISDYKEIVQRPEPPSCECRTIPDGKSGNIVLDTKASYNSYKFCCRPQLRTFLYSDGPKHFTHVARTPEVPELNRNGKIIYGSF